MPNLKQGAVPKVQNAAKCPTCEARVRLVYVAGRDALNFHLNPAGGICGGSYLEATVTP